MKGISMSINTIIILVIGLIVLASLLAIFMGSATPGGNTMKCQAKWNAECAKYVAAGGCDDINKGDLDSLKNAASCMGISEADVRDTCCQNSTTITT
ncbi:MAG: hypothetical protein J7K87_03290 [Candidatus Aenigmarchaeota archaeon]|nr:hypothetical protein [Candidatus Aenigmarchaeota archaeon]